MNYDKTNKIYRATERIKSRIDSIVHRHFNVEVDIESDGTIDINAEDYFKYQDDGVRGTEGGNTRGGYRYNDKMPPPSSFSKYTADKQAQFAIAKSIQQKGIKPHDYTREILRDGTISDCLEDIMLDYVEQTIDNSKL